MDASIITNAALRLQCFARRLPGDFTFSLSAFPPFEEVGFGAIIPDMLLTGPIQRDEPQDPVSVTDFLDDANLLFRSHCLPLVMRNKWQTLGVYFSIFIDTKSRLRSLY